jgi:hypothetical protein
MKFSCDKAYGDKATVQVTAIELDKACFVINNFNNECLTRDYFHGGKKKRLPA